MHHLTKFMAVSALFLAATVGASAVALSIAGDLFTNSAATGKAKVAEATRPAGAESAAKNPTSPLLGANPASVAHAKEQRKDNEKWVEVVDAVNMRKGPSSARPVIKVQLAGTALRVSSREGKWVEVIEPESGQTGWVFQKYVKQIEPVSRRADAADTTLR